MHWSGRVQTDRDQLPRLIGSAEVREKGEQDGGRPTKVLPVRAVVLGRNNVLAWDGRLYHVLLGACSLYIHLYKLY